MRILLEMSPKALTMTVFLAFCGKKTYYMISYSYEGSGTVEISSLGKIIGFGISYLKF